jgi:type VI protein secretion system component Hcp
MRSSRLTRRLAIGLGAIALTAFALARGTVPVQAAIDSYMSFDGSALTAPTPQGFEIESFSMGTTAPTAAQSSGSGAGRTSLGSLTVTRTVDSASPKLFQACASGQHFPKLRIVAGGRTVVFDDVLIARVNTAAGGTKPLETLTFNYAKVETTDRPTTTLIETHPMIMPPAANSTKKP